MLFESKITKKDGEYHVEVLKRDSGLKVTYQTPDVDRALDIHNSYTVINEEHRAKSNSKKRLSADSQERLHQAYTSIYGKQGVSSRIERVSSEEDDSPE